MTSPLIRRFYKEYRKTETGWQLPKGVTFIPTEEPSEVAEDLWEEYRSTHSDRLLWEFPGALKSGSSLFEDDADNYKVLKDGELVGWIRIRTFPDDKGYSKSSDIMPIAEGFLPEIIPWFKLWLYESGTYHTIITHRKFLGDSNGPVIRRNPIDTYLKASVLSVAKTPNLHKWDGQQSWVAAIGFKAKVKA